MGHQPPSPDPSLRMTDRSSRPPPTDADAIQRSRSARPGPNLRAFERERLAANLDRLAADRDLILHLQLSNFDETTEDWKTFARALTEYGYAVFRAWFATGEIKKHLAAKRVHGRHELPEPYRLGDEGAAHDLAADLVVDGVRSFRTKVLLEGTWDAKAGASIKTYFVGHLLFRVPETFRRWQQNNGFDQILTDDQRVLEPDLRPGHSRPRGAEGRVDDAIVADQLLQHLSPSERRLFQLEAADLDTLEVADAVGGVSASKVKTDKMRARQRINRIYQERSEWIG